MKTWVLVTTILLSTPEKDYSGVVIYEFDNEIACDIELKKQTNVKVIGTKENNKSVMILHGSSWVF